MEEFALIKSRFNLNRVDLGIVLISDLKVIPSLLISGKNQIWITQHKICTLTN